MSSSVYTVLSSSSFCITLHFGCDGLNCSLIQWNHPSESSPSALSAPGGGSDGVSGSDSDGDSDGDSRGGSGSDSGGGSELAVQTKRITRSSVVIRMSDFAILNGKLDYQPILIGSKYWPKPGVGIDRNFKLEQSLMDRNFL